jgi:integrase
LVHNILHRALKDAKRLRIVRENVVDFVEPLKELPPKTVWWTVKQMAQFLAVVAHDPLEAFWRMALLVGLRRGELLGLKWADVDMEKRILVLERSYSRRGGEFVDGPVKSDSSKEPVLLSESVVASLLAHWERQLQVREHAGSAYQDNDLVFATAEGLHIHPNTLRYQFKRLIALAGVPDIRIHDMRHSNGSAMGSTPGTNMRIVQARLRHASLRTTERYMHTDVDGQTNIVQGLDDQITGHGTPC